MISLVSAFELQGTSPANIPATSFASNADLKSVGVTSDFKATNSVVPVQTKIFFGIATHGKWSTPSDVQFNIFIDRDMNGTDDFQIINTAFADAQGNAFDVFVSARRALPHRRRSRWIVSSTTSRHGSRNRPLQHQHDGDSGDRFVHRFDYGECQIQLSHHHYESWVRWHHRYDANSHVRCG